jgi:hypothetical protein
MLWYRESLRKNYLRIDLGIYCANLNNLNDFNSISTATRNILLTAIFQGLDIIGLVDANGPNIGWLGAQIAVQNNLDIFVLPGQQYHCKDGEHLNVYKLREVIPPDLSCNEVIKLAKSKGGFVMATNITRRQAQRFNSSVGSDEAPNAVEIYNASIGGFTDIELDYPKFVSSASQGAGDITHTNVYTTKSREEVEIMGLLPKDWGVDYVPNYLEIQNQINNQITQNPIVDSENSKPGKGVTDV